MDNLCFSKTAALMLWILSVIEVERENLVATIINKNDLPGNETSRTFEGQPHDAKVSFFLSETPPGRGPRLHTHPYEEVFIVQAGKLTFTVDDETIEVGEGIIVVVPAGVRHKFINSGTEVARHIDLHTSQQMITDWVEK
jgi:mannose-6-phosphate isomerase-like protein (cupin superfamily)